MVVTPPVLVVLPVFVDGVVVPPEGVLPLFDGAGELVEFAFRSVEDHVVICATMVSAMEAAIPWCPPLTFSTKREFAGMSRLTRPVEIIRSWDVKASVTAKRGAWKVPWHAEQFVCSTGRKVLENIEAESTAPVGRVDPLDDVLPTVMAPALSPTPVTGTQAFREIKAAAIPRYFIR